MNTDSNAISRTNQNEKSCIYWWTNESAAFVHRAGTSSKKCVFLPFPGSQECDFTSPKCRGPGSKVTLFFFFSFLLFSTVIFRVTGICCFYMRCGSLMISKEHTFICCCLPVMCDDYFGFLFPDFLVTHFLF